MTFGLPQTAASGAPTEHARVTTSSSVVTARGDRRASRRPAIRPCERGVVSSPKTRCATGIDLRSSSFFFEALTDHKGTSSRCAARRVLFIFLAIELRRPWYISRSICEACSPSGIIRVRRFGLARATTSNVDNSASFMALPHHGRVCLRHRTLPTQSVSGAYPARPPERMTHDAVAMFAHVVVPSFKPLIQDLVAQIVPASRRRIRTFEAIWRRR